MALETACKHANTGWALTLVRVTSAPALGGRRGYSDSLVRQGALDPDAKFEKIWENLLKFVKILENLEKLEILEFFKKMLRKFIFFRGRVYNASQIDTFHRKHKNRGGNPNPLGPNSQFSFLRSVTLIPFVESLDCLHCIILYRFFFKVSF